MYLHIDDGNYKIYKRAQDKLRLGTAPLGGISYYFYKGQLERVVFTSGGGESPLTILQILEEAYGPADKDPDSSYTYWWSGERVWVKFIYDSHANPATTVTMVSRSLEQRKKSDVNGNEKVRARQGMKDL